MSLSIKEESGRIPGRIVVSLNQGTDVLWQKETDLSGLETVRELAAKQLRAKDAANALRPTRVVFVEEWPENETPLKWLGTLPIQRGQRVDKYTHGNQYVLGVQTQSSTELSFFDRDFSADEAQRYLEQAAEAFTLKLKESRERAAAEWAESRLPSSSLRPSC